MTNADWGGYRAIIDEAREIEREEKQRPLVDCPICGTPLDKNERGELNCNMGHFRAPAGTTRGSVGG